ncbi:MAG: ankyrin repeat domain-containing protein [Bacillota bacterium]
MLKENLFEHDFSDELVETIKKKLNLQFELNSRKKLEQLILASIDVLISQNNSQANLAEFYQQALQLDNKFKQLTKSEIDFLNYQLLEAAEDNSFWEYRLLIKIINRLDYLKTEGVEMIIKAELKSYFSKKLSQLEADLFAVKEEQESKIATIVQLIFNFWEQQNNNWHKQDLLLIKLQLTELDLDPQQKIKIKDFYRYLNSNPDLCLEFTSKISKSSYQEYEFQDLPLVSAILELEKLINNDHYLCAAIVNKINSLGIDYKQEQFNLEILADCLANNGDFDLEQELILFNFIVELVTDLTKVSVAKEKEKAGQELIAAIKEENYVRAQELINSEVEVNIKDEQGRTPLIWAAEKGNDELMMQLMRAGAKLDITDNQGRTVLSRIHNCHQMEVMQRLNRNNN